MRSGFLPPETTALRGQIASRNVRRMRRLLRLLHPRNARQRELLAALEATLKSLSGPRREEWLLDPGVRAWLDAAAEATSLARVDIDRITLFERVAAGPHLSEVAPAGRIDRRFRARVATLAHRLLERVFLRLPSLLMFQTPRGSEFGPFPLDLAEDAEEARLAGELHLSLPAPLTLRIEPGTRVALVAGGIRFAGYRQAPWLQARDRIPGTAIVLARSLVSTRAGRRPGPHVAGLGMKLGRALNLLLGAWPAGYAEVLASTREIVPLYERGTVSFSQPDRPGISYIRIPGKSVINLADDLLHETAHHRLHALEEIGPLTRDDGEPRYFSPWRNSVRPLRGILHAAYTFSYRAQLLARMANRSGRLPRAWIRSELAAEKRALRAALADLADADSRGLLTRPGGELFRLLLKRRPWIPTN